MILVLFILNYGVNNITIFEYSYDCCTILLSEYALAVHVIILKPALVLHKLGMVVPFIDTIFVAFNTIIVKALISVPVVEVLVALPMWLIISPLAFIVVPVFLYKPAPTRKTVVLDVAPIIRPILHNEHTISALSLPVDEGALKHGPIF